VSCYFCVIINDLDSRW